MTANFEGYSSKATEVLREDRMLEHNLHRYGYEPAMAVTALNGDYAGGMPLVDAGHSQSIIDKRAKHLQDLLESDYELFGLREAS